MHNKCVCTVNALCVYIETYSFSVELFSFFAYVDNLIKVADIIFSISA